MILCLYYNYIVILHCNRNKLYESYNKHMYLSEMNCGLELFFACFCKVHKNYGILHFAYLHFTVPKIQHHDVMCWCRCQC